MADFSIVPRPACLQNSRPWSIGASVAGTAVGGCLLVAGFRRIRRVWAARRQLQELLLQVAGEDARIVITGATSGIGREMARQFAAHRPVSLLLGCRDPSRAAGQYGSNVRAVRLELLDYDSVQNFADEAHAFLSEGGPGLRLLVNNAGVMRHPGDSSAKGICPTWQTNFLAPFLLTELLARHRAVKPPTQSLRVVHVSSRLERRSQLDEALLERVSRGQPGEHAYSDSKRALMLWTSVRAQNFAFRSNMFVHTSTPGMVDTQLGRHSMPPWLWPFTKPLRWLLLRSPAEGALGAVAGGLTPEAVACFGRYFDGQKQLEDLVMERMGEKQLAQRITKWASEATALEPRATGYDR